MAERSHTSPLVNFQSWDQLVAHWPDPVLVFDSDSRRYIVVNDAREIPAVVAQAEREGAVRRPWRARCKDGSIVQTEMTLTRRRIDGRVVSQGIFRVLGDGLPSGQAADGGAEVRLEILERTSLAVVALDRDGVVTYWNQGAAERYGLAADDAIGRQVLDLAPTDADRASVESLMSHHEQHDEWTSRLTINPVEGDPFEALVTGSAIRTDDGEMNGFLFVTTPLDSSTRTSSPRMRRARVKCAACGREVTGTMRRKYCSEKCRQWAYYHRHLDAQRERSRQRHERRRSDADGETTEPPSR